LHSSSIVDIGQCKALTLLITDRSAIDIRKIVPIKRTIAAPGGRSRAIEREAFPVVFDVILNIVLRIIKILNKYYYVQFRIIITYL